MAKTCEICGKGKLKAAKLTFSHKQIVKRQSPNVQEIRVLDENEHSVRKCVCTSCLKAGKVQKAI
jgi:large subunit ribosomal protein L28